MNRIQRTITLCIMFMTLAIGMSVFAGTREVISYDRVSASDWSYDALISLASDGLIPGMAARVFQGDRIFNRMEIADVIASIVDTNNIDNLTDNQKSLINKLVYEYKPELGVHHSDIVEKWTSVSDKTSPITVTGYAQGKYHRDIYDDDSIVVPYKVTGFADIKDHIFAAGTFADKNKQFFYRDRDPSIPDKFIFKGYDKNFVWTVGRQYMNWGPSYAGSMILSDNSRSFLQLNAVNEVDLGKSIGRIKITQFGTGFNDHGDTAYLFGRRYEKPLSDNFMIGINETAKTDEIPNPGFYLMPFYLYQHLTDKDYNIICSLDLLYHTDDGKQFYVDFMVDDMSSDKIFVLGRDDWRRKTGYTIGAYLPEFIPGSNISTLRAEFISIDPKTYGPVSSSNKLDYYHGPWVIGHPLGRNVNAFYIRAEQYITPKVSLIAEYLNQKQKKNEEPYIASSHTVSAQLSYDITPSSSISFRVAPTKVKIPSQMMEPAQNGTRVSESGTEYEIRFSQSF